MHSNTRRFESTSTTSSSKQHNQYDFCCGQDIIADKRRQHTMCVVLGRILLLVLADVQQPPQVCILSMIFAMIISNLIMYYQKATTVEPRHPHIQCAGRVRIRQAEPVVCSTTPAGMYRDIS